MQGSSKKYPNLCAAFCAGETSPVDCSHHLSTTYNKNNRNSISNAQTSTNTVFASVPFASEAAGWTGGELAPAETDRLGAEALELRASAEDAIVMPSGYICALLPTCGCWVLNCVCRCVRSRLIVSLDGAVRVWGPLRRLIDLRCFLLPLCGRRHAPARPLRDRAMPAHFNTAHQQLRLLLIF